MAQHRQVEVEVERHLEHRLAVAIFYDAFGRDWRPDRRRHVVELVVKRGLLLRRLVFL
jgi:hypothetical protein